MCALRALTLEPTLSQRTAMSRCRQSCCAVALVRSAALSAAPAPRSNPVLWPWPGPRPRLLLARRRGACGDTVPEPERTGPVLYCFSIRSSAAVRPPCPGPPGA